MGILNYLPSFKVVEPNKLAAFHTGQVLSQNVYGGEAATTVGTVDFLENGLILGLDSDLQIGDYTAEHITSEETVAASHKQPVLHFTEELNTFLDGNKRFAVEEDADGEIYPRALALYVGDVFTTDNYDLNGKTLANVEFATVVGGKITLQEAEGEGDSVSIFAAEASTTPLGTDAVKVTYLGV